MDLILKVNKEFPCSPIEFTINGMKANESDFGQGIDDRMCKHCSLPGRAGVDATDYGCIDFVWQPNFEKIVANNIMRKYSLTIEDLCYICDELKRTLSVGSCDRCGLAYYN